MTASQQRILIVDDHPLVNAGLVAMLQSLPHKPVIFSAGTAAQALEQAEYHAPLDLIILDLNLPDTNGTSLVAALKTRGRGAKVLVISAQGQSDAVNRALADGASGFLSKSVPTAQLCESVIRLLQSQSIKPFVNFGTDLVTAASEPNQRPPDCPVLTARQLDVLLMLDQGLTNRDIGLQLGVTEKTVKNHVTSLFQALQVINRLQATRKARVWGLLK
jgi:two-component system nitrate/nitrite response regulator NarL